MMRADKRPVALLHCPDYDRSRLTERIDAVLSCLLPVKFTGKRVLLKPNFVSSRGPGIACTDPEFLRAVSLWFKDHGARVAIGDSPAFGSTMSVLKSHGMSAVLRDAGCEPVDFHSPVVCTVRGGITLGIARQALECDLLVNLPKLKAHNQMFLTCAVKNFFGTVVGIQKAGLHMRHGSSHDKFAEILLELPALLPDNISLVDGVVAMHRSGPMDGESLNVGCIGGAKSAIALDTALLQALELPRQMSPLWRAAITAGYPDADPAHIDFAMERPESFYGSGFRAPAVLNPIRFNPFRLIMSTMRRVKIALCN